MFCPNCGHKVDPDQKFCDNCGAALKKNTTETSEPKDDDTIRSLSEIENELNQEEPTNKSHEEPKKDPVLQQAPAQKREFESHTQNTKPAETVKKDPEPEMKTFERSHGSSFNKSGADQPLDDRTQVYSKNDFNPISQKPYKKSSEDPIRKPFDHIKDPISDPFKPTKSEQRAAQAKKEAEAVDPNDGLIHNMIKFAQNNILVDIIAIIITAILLVVKRNYGFIVLAAVILVWFLLSQMHHGKELSANKALKKETSLKHGKREPDNNSEPTETYQ